MREAHGNVTAASQCHWRNKPLLACCPRGLRRHFWGITVKSFLWRGLIAAGLIALAGCSTTALTGSTGTNLANANGATGTIRVINDSGEYIDVVLISDCDAFTYGMENQLPPNEGIPHGSYYDFIVPSGCWDVAAGSIGVGDARQRLNLPPNGIFELTIG
jgi:hypothetical protein